MSDDSDLATEFYWAYLRQTWDERDLKPRVLLAEEHQKLMRESDLAKMRNHRDELQAKLQKETSLPLIRLDAIAKEYRTRRNLGTGWRFLLQEIKATAPEIGNERLSELCSLFSDARVLTVP